MNQQKSFTLIELLVVIAVIGLLSSVVLVSMSGVRDKARIAKGLEFHQTIQNGIGAYVVGWWSFETIETGSKVLDGSGYGNDGTVTGATVVAGLEQLGNALSFDGASYVNCGSNASLDNLISTDNKQIAIEAWIKPNSFPLSSNRAGIVDKGRLGSEGYGMGLLGNKINFGYHGNGNFSGNQGLTAGQWYHVAVVRNAVRNNDIYINGTLDKHDTSSSFTSAAASYDLYIGYIQGGYYFNGLIDEVRIYERALSAIEIQKHYTEDLARHQNLVKK